jgi:hypothetical protein
VSLVSGEPDVAPQRPTDDPVLKGSGKTAVFAQLRDDLRYDQSICAMYRTLADRYRADRFVSEGDFSERMALLLESIKDRHSKKYGGDYDDAGPFLHLAIDSERCELVAGAKTRSQSCNARQPF